MDNSFSESLDYSFVKEVNKTQNTGYSRAQSHINYFMNKEYVQHPNKCDIYEKSHINSVPMALYSDVVDVESELINRTRKLSKCSSRHLQRNTECMKCDYGKKCKTSKCLTGSKNTKCDNLIVNHHDYAPFSDKYLG